MTIIHLNEHTPMPAPSVASIGFFDGLHRGHRFLIDRMKTEARTASLCTMAVTFDAHPRQVLGKGDAPKMLSTLHDRLSLLEQAGIDYCVVLHFDKNLAALTAREFMETVLQRQLNVKKLLLGYDNRFGRNREEGPDDYLRHGRELGIEVVFNEPFDDGDTRISSSVIRRFLEHGEVEAAQRCLGYAYRLSGTVAAGYQEGRKLGYPTANLQINDTSVLIPHTGIYITEVELEGHPGLLPAMTDVGYRPTFGTFGLTVETHILDFQADIYGKSMTVAFLKRLREEEKYDTLSQLVAQLRLDEAATRAYFRQRNG